MSQNGKGDKPRSCFSRQFKDNFDSIDWTPKNTYLGWHKELYPKWRIMDVEGSRTLEKQIFGDKRITKEEFFEIMGPSTIRLMEAMEALEKKDLPRQK
jgi:hypothetical protein